MRNTEGIREASDPGKKSKPVKFKLEISFENEETFKDFVASMNRKD